MRARGGRLALVLAAATVGSTVASCGSRTELFGGPTPSTTSRAPGAVVDAGTDADAGDQGGVPCIPGTFPLERGVAKVVLVVDRSGSMKLSLSSNEEPLPGEPSRWDALRAAVSQAIAPFDGELALGVTIFPDAFDSGESTRGCAVADSETLAPAVGNAAAVASALTRGQPFGGTPTVEAVKAAAELLRATRGTVRALVLATDGAPNCNAGLDPHACTCTTTGTPGGCGSAGNGTMCLDDARAIRTVEEVATKDRIPVYVLGIAEDPQESFARTLAALAVAGGRPRGTSPEYYPARSPGELTSALATIRDGVAQCTYLTPSAPGEDENAGSIEVLVDGVSVPHDPTRREGWDWVDQRYGQLAFFGTACARVSRATGSTNVTAEVRCRR